MDGKERTALIRQGNELFNKGEIRKAGEVFARTMYRDGLTRVGDHFYFDKKLPLVAVTYYRLAGATDKINEIYARMVMALGEWLGRKPGDDDAAGRVSLPPLKVSPKLKILAEEILRDGKNG
ncbi:MAG: hypothetical protein EPN93_19035 [Spirochaetes bacterium]|nr:MAG: hypothetical protein EPN93_19035 [Spirochaetota bacterium]